MIRDRPWLHSKSTLDLPFQIWGTGHSCHGEQRAERKGSSGNRGLCSSFRGIFLKSHQMLLLLLKLYSSIFSHADNLPQQKTRLSWQPIASSSIPSYTPVCFILARAISDTWRSFCAKSTGLACLLVSCECLLAPLAQPSVRKGWALRKADRDWAQLIAVG